MNRWKKIIAIVVTVLTFLGSAGGWIDGRYAKAADVQRLEQQLEKARLEIRAGQIKTTLAYLRQESFELRAASENRKLSLLEIRRLSDVEADIKTNERELRLLRMQQGDLPEF